MTTLTEYPDEVVPARTAPEHPATVNTKYRGLDGARPRSRPPFLLLPLSNRAVLKSGQAGVGRRYQFGCTLSLAA